MASLYQKIGEYEKSLECYQKSIAIHKGIGNFRSEGINLGNVGDLYYKLNQKSKAIKSLERAIVLCDQIIPAAAGAFRGSLALILAKEGQNEQPSSLLQIGEEQIKIMPEEYGKFLCKKGQIQLLAGKGEEAKKTLEHAQNIATTLQLTEESELTKANWELQKLLGIFWEKY